MSYVAVINYGMGNLDSVRRALEICGATVRVTSNHIEIGGADRIVLPGVGAFGRAISNLQELELPDLLTHLVRDNHIPFLGICLGMQLMMTCSSERGYHDGFGWVPGTVDRLPVGNSSLRVPHIGWNEVTPSTNHPVLVGLGSNTDFYFVHSYAVNCENQENSIARTPYAGGFSSIIGAGSAIGVQFHPEKSQKAGQLLLKNWLAWPSGTRKHA